MLAALVTFTAQAAPEFPALTGRVVDQANILSPQTERQLTQMLAQHEQETSNQVVVVTLNSLQGYPIEDYGYQLGREWGIGQKGRDNGVLLIIAPTEKKMRIEVGYGLEGSLTDAISKNILSTVIRPRFRQGDMNGGVVAGTQAILSAIEGTYKPQKRSRRSSGGAFDFFGVAVIFTMIFGGIVRHFIGNRIVASGVMGAIAFGIGWLIFSVGVGIFAGFAVFLLTIFTGLGGGGGGGYYGGGYYGGGYSSGGSFGGGFSGGGGGFGGGGASGGW